jgi:hypothetical protein
MYDFDEMNEGRNFESGGGLHEAPSAKEAHAFSDAAAAVSKDFFQ